MDAARSARQPRTPDGSSAYFRLSTRPIDQSLAAVPDEPAAREQRRRHVLAGGYVLRAAERAPDVALVGMGADPARRAGRGRGALGGGTWRSTSSA